MLEYIHVRWNHDSAEDPVDMFYEVRPDRCVLRMVEVFRDGRSVANTLAWEKQLHPAFVGISLADDMPEFEQLPNNHEFMPSRITKQDFEAAFRRATPITETTETSRMHP